MQDTQDTQNDTAALVAAFHAAGYRTIKYKTGYRGLTPKQRQELNRNCDEPRAAFGSFNKTNPHTKKRFSYYENK